YLSLHAPRSTLFPYTTLFRSRSNTRSSSCWPRSMIDPCSSSSFSPNLSPWERTPFPTLLRERGRACLVSSSWFELEETSSPIPRSEEHTSELQSRENLVCRLL